MRYKNSSGRKCLPSDVTCHCSTSPFTRARIVTRRPFLHAAFAKFRRHTTHSHRAERSTRSPRLGSGAVTWNVTACRGASRRGVSIRGSSSGVSLPSLRVYGGGGVDHGGARDPPRAELVDGAVGDLDDKDLFRAGSHGVRGVEFPRPPDRARRLWTVPSVILSGLATGIPCYRHGP